MNIIRYLIKTSVFAASLGIASSAMAVAYEFNTIWTSSGTPAGPAPYASLTVTQFGTDTVKLKLEATSLGLTEFISYLKYNIAGSATVPGITASITDQFGLPTAPSITFGAGTDASLSFDAEVGFETTGKDSGIHRFTDGEYLEWTLSRTGLVVDDIDLDMMIHIQGISGGGSAKIIATTRPDTSRVPDGGSTVLFIGSSLLGLAALTRRWMR